MTTEATGGTAENYDYQLLRSMFADNPETKALLPDFVRTNSERLHEIAIQTYIYAYPMVMMEVIRRVSTNVEGPVGVLRSA